MEDPIKQLFIVELAQSEKKLATPLAYEEINALQYTAGYIIQALQQKIERSAHPLVEELVLCLVEVGGEGSGRARVGNVDQYD